MHNGWNDSTRDLGRGREDKDMVQEIIANARKFITGESLEPESLLGYEGSVRKFVESNPDKNTTASHQLRKFYSDIVDIWEIAEKSFGNASSPDISKLKIRLAMMEARLNYAKERKVLSEGVFKLMTECVSTVNRETGIKWVESLERFRTFFEAFVAYSYKGR